MKKITILIFIIVVLSSCKREVPTGTWNISFDEKETPFNFPNSILFKKDTLFIIDGNNYKYKTTYKLNRDSIKITFENGEKISYSFRSISDSILVFGKNKFLKNTEDYPFNQHYELYGYKTKNILEQSSPDFSIAHLIKVNGKSQLVLNDKVTDIRKITNFIHGQQPSHLILLYIGKDIEFIDLLEIYQWLKRSNIYKVKLITGNKSLKEFYFLKDYININNELTNSFKLKHNLFQQPYLINNPKYDHIMIIKSSNDFKKLLEMSMEDKYLIKVDKQISLQDYFKLLEILYTSKKSKWKKIIF